MPFKLLNNSLVSFEEAILEHGVFIDAVQFSSPRMSQVQRAELRGRASVLWHVQRAAQRLAAATEVKSLKNSKSASSIVGVVK